MITIDKQTEQKLIELLPQLHDATLRQFISKNNDEKLFRIIADIRDYFQYQVLNCPNKEIAKEIIKRYDLYQLFYSIHNYLSQSEFYSGYFFSLSNILAVKYEIKLIENEKIKYNDFEISFKETLKDLKLDEYNPFYFK